MIINRISLVLLLGLSLTGCAAKWNPTDINCYDIQRPEFVKSAYCENARDADMRRYEQDKREQDQWDRLLTRENQRSVPFATDSYGRPMTLQGGMPNSYIQTPNAYGPGIHMDQYGNAVRQ